MPTITASEARRTLFPLIEKVNTGRRNHVRITSKTGNAVLLSETEWDSIQETMNIMSSPHLYKKLLHAVEDIKLGKGIEMTHVNREWIQKSKLRSLPKKVASKNRKHKLVVKSRTRKVLSK